MNKNMLATLLAVFKNPLLFVWSALGAVLCLLLGIYYALPGVYHISLSHSHPPMNPKLDYTAVFLICAVLCAGIAVLSRRLIRARVD